MKFEARVCLLAGERKLDDYQRRVARVSVLDKIKVAYGDNFPYAMMNIKNWSESEGPWYPDRNHPDGWNMWPLDKRPDVFYVRVEIADGIGRQAVRVTVACAEQSDEDGGSTVPNPGGTVVPPYTRRTA